MAHPYEPIHTDDVVLAEETSGNVMPDPVAEPFDEKSQPPVRKASGSPAEEFPEKVAMTASPHASLKSFPSSQDLPYPILSKRSQADLSRSYRAGKQLRDLLFWGFLRWLVTAGLLGLLGITIWKFSTYDKMDNGDRLWFNSILTGMSIVIGLAVASHLNAMTFNMRWWFLSLHERPLCEVNAIIKSDIMNIQSYTLNAWIAGFAILWLFINIASQVAIACVSLVVSVDSTSAAVFLSPGMVSITDMSHFYSMLGSKAVPSYAGEEFTANIYGNFANSSLFYDSIDTLPAPGNTYDPNFVDLFDGGDYWLYDFLEGPPNSNNWPINALSSLVYTNRTINSTFSCTTYTVNPVSGNGSSSLIDVFLNGTNEPSTTITVPSVAFNETTFFVDNRTCGSRCGFISIFQASFTTPQFYQCNITISEVGNASLPQHLINDTFAQLAARSIALGATSKTGYYYQRYPEDSNYGILIEGDSDAMGKQIAYFSIGSLAVAYLSNPTVIVTGLEPEPAYFLNIHSNTKLIVIFVLISGVQLLIFLITTLIASNVIIIDDSPVAISRLLYPIMARLGSGGTILGGKEISDVLKMEDKDVLGNEEMKVIYTAKRYDAEGTRARLVLGDGTRERAFKSGHYD